MKYVSKPTEVEAMQWGGALPLAGSEIDAEMIVAWVNANGGEARYEPDTPGRMGDEPVVRPARIAVRTINGWAYAAPGHYVVMGEATFVAENPTFFKDAVRFRDFYPCDPETFERRWSAAAGVSS